MYRRPMWAGPPSDPANLLPLPLAQHPRQDLAAGAAVPLAKDWRSEVSYELYMYRVELVDKAGEVLAVVFVEAPANVKRARVVCRKETS